MSEQTVSKSVPAIPQRIIKEIEDFFSEPSTTKFEHPVFQKVESVEFIRTFQNRDGICEEFKVNGVILVCMIDEDCWTYKTVSEDKEDKKAFGKRVTYVMQEANVPWNLAKLAVKRNPVDSWHSESTANADALKFIEEVNEVLDKYRILGKKRMSVEGYLKLCFSAYLNKKQISIIKEYWLSQNA